MTGRRPISIHALREEGDHVQFVHLNGLQLISIHALREEGDQEITKVSYTSDIFQSTPSARRATKGGLHILGRGEISIHALREEGDLDAPGNLSTSSRNR